MALFDPHKNFSYSTVATAPSPATSGTSLVVASGDGAKFPAVPFNVTIWPAGTQPTAANAEIARVTNISTDTFTITRTQEGFGPRTVIVGDQIAATETAKLFSDLENLHTITSKSADYPATAADSTIQVDASGAPVTITLPTAVGIAGKTYTIKKTDATSNVVTIATTSAQTIDGQTTQTTNAQYTAITVISDGANWSII